MAIIISPPFGTYVRTPQATSVLGSYTYYRRPGRWLKIGQFILDNIQHPVPGGWRNRMGLRNPGIFSLDQKFSDKVIYSIVGLEDGEWDKLYSYLMWARRRRLYLELNLGCQNVHEYTIPRSVLEQFCREFYISVKLPAGGKNTIDCAEFCLSVGVRKLHVANTLTTDLGSISGRPLKLANLGATEEIAKRFPEAHITGGGGIYELEDAIDYHNGGATDISLATIWFHPIRAHRLLRQYSQWSDLRERDEIAHNTERQTGIGSHHRIS